MKHLPEKQKCFATACRRNGIGIVLGPSTPENGTQVEPTPPKFLQTKAARKNLKRFFKGLESGERKKVQTKAPKQSLNWVVL